MSAQSFSSVGPSGSQLSQLQKSYSNRHANRSVSGGPVENDGPPPILLYSFADSYGNGDTTCDACCPKRRCCKPRCCKPRRCCKPKCCKPKCCKKPKRCCKKRRFCPVGCKKRRPGYKQR